ncbi:MAG: hypothetical protein J07HX5_00305 [halophilic archaeon J07HX5]|nr:MAG: hypothetical protein J07HX5_00305 [halophilic archaeon J07HX5]
MRGKSRVRVVLAERTAVFPTDCVRILCSSSLILDSASLPAGAQNNQYVIYWRATLGTVGTVRADRVNGMLDNTATTNAATLAPATGYRFSDGSVAVNCSIARSAYPSARSGLL